MYKTVLFLVFSYSVGVYAFDLEDYATTYRATRDAYLKSANELKLATGPYTAARDAYVKASAKYIESLGSPDAIRITTESAKARKKCLEEYKALRNEYYSKYTTYVFP